MRATFCSSACLQSCSWTLSSRRVTTSRLLGVLLWQLGKGLFGLAALGSEGAPQDFTDHHVSRLLRLSSQAGSLCVSSAFGNGGVVLAVGPALHTFPLDLCGEVQNFPASFSSSELSAHQMAPSGASRTSGVVADSSSWTPAACEPEVRN